MNVLPLFLMSLFALPTFCFGVFCLVQILREPPKPEISLFAIENELRTTPPRPETTVWMYERELYWRLINKEWVICCDFCRTPIEAARLVPAERSPCLCGLSVPLSEL